MAALKLPDGPQTHPWVQTLQWLASPLEYMEACAKRYGDIFTLWIGPVFAPLAPYEFLPFGGGNRTCIGMPFAQFEMKLVLATVLSHWELELADSKPVEPVRKGALLGPAQGVPMVVRGKRSENQRILHSSYF